MKDKSLKKNRMLRKDDYIGETERYLLTRWGEYKNPTHDSQLVHHLKNTWIIALIGLLLLMRPIINGTEKLGNNIYCFKEI